MSRERIMVLGGVRTPFCKAGTKLAHLDAADLARTVISALLTRLDFDPELIDEVIMGCVAQPADAMNVARVGALRAGVPVHVPAVTVHRNCASGFESITLACDKIHAGRGSIYLVGGVESMSGVPLLFRRKAAAKLARIAKAKEFSAKLKSFAAMRPSDFIPLPALKSGLSDPVCGLSMGETAELLAREEHISREEQDAFALASHQKAAAAEDRRADETTPAYDLCAGEAITADNGVRPGQTLDALAGLRPLFERETGTVTAGNASQVTDGAVALLLAGETAGEELGLEPLGFVDDYAYAGCDPAHMGLGPVFAIQRLLKQTGRQLSEADIVEINEAFAAQVLAVLRRLRVDGPREVPLERLNVNGGAIALGHPVGATGARLVLTALKELKRRNARHALASLCVGGGQGGALWLEAA